MSKAPNTKGTELIMVETMPTRTDNRRFRIMAIMPVPPPDLPERKINPDPQPEITPAKMAAKSGFSTVIWKFVVRISKREKKTCPTGLRKRISRKSFSNP
jgi:hypothetical protein